MKQKLEENYPRKLDQENDAALPGVMSRVETIERNVDSPEINPEDTGRGQDVRAAGCGLSLPFNDSYTNLRNGLSSLRRENQRINAAAGATHAGAADGYGRPSLFYRQRRVDEVHPQVLLKMIGPTI